MSGHTNTSEYYNIIALPGAESIAGQRDRHFWIL
jgi:hypothetical protein